MVRETRPRLTFANQDNQRSVLVQLDNLSGTLFDLVKHLTKCRRPRSEIPLLSCGAVEAARRPTPPYPPHSPAGSPPAHPDCPNTQNATPGTAGHCPP